MERFCGFPKNEGFGLGKIGRGFLSSMEYTFDSASVCNMCSSPVSAHRVLGRRLNRPQGLRPWRKVGVSTTVLQCNNCGLIYANPLPIPGSLQDHYGIPPEDYWEQGYLGFGVDGGDFSVEIQTFMRLRVGEPGSRQLKALDVGAGIGKGMTALAHAGFEVYGIEPSESFHRMAIEKIGIGRDRLQLARIEDAEFAEGFFDFIVFSAVLEHFYDPAAAIRNALKWIKPDGLIRIEVPSANWLINRLARLFYRAMGSDYVANLSPMHPPFHLYEFSPQSFEAHGAKNKYRIVHRQFHVCPTYMPKLLDRLLRPIMEATKTGMQLTVWLRRLS